VDSHHHSPLEPCLGLIGGGRGSAPGLRPHRPAAPGSQGVKSYHHPLLAASLALIEGEGLCPSPRSARFRSRGPPLPRPSLAPLALRSRPRPLRAGCHTTRKMAQMGKGGKRRAKPVEGCVLMRKFGSRWNAIVGTFATRSWHSLNSVWRWSVGGGGHREALEVDLKRFEAFEGWSKEGVISSPPRKRAAGRPKGTSDKVGV